MPSAVFSISALLVGISVLLVGNGILAMLLGLRAAEAFNKTTTGIVMAGYFLGYLAGSFIVPRIIRSVGYIRTFAALAALASVAALAYGTTRDPTLWWLLRFVSGGCLVGIYMVVENWLNEVTPSAQRGRVLGLYMATTLLALGVGLVLAPLTGVSPGLEPFALASVFFTLGLIPVAITPMPQPHPVAAPAARFQRLFAVSPTGFLGAMIAGVVNGIFWGLGPAFFRGFGLSEYEASLFMAIIIAGGVLFQWPIGHLSDGRDRRLVLSAVCLAAAVAALLSLVTVSQPRALLALCAFAYGGLMFTLYSLSVAHVNDRVTQLEILEAARTLLLLYGFGAALGPMVAGPLMDYFGPPALPLFSAGSLMFLAAAAVQQMIKKPAVSAVDQGVFVPLARTSQVAVEMLPEATARGDQSDQARDIPLTIMEGVPPPRKMKDLS